MCIEYWIDKVDDPELAHSNHVKNNCLSLENYIRKYGEEDGLSRHNAKSFKKADNYNRAPWGIWLFYPKF